MGGLAAFDRYIGIDYSGTETPKSSLKGLRVYMADRHCVPQNTHMYLGYRTLVTSYRVPVPVEILSVSATEVPPPSPSQKKEPERSLYFTSTCPARLQSPPMPGCRGCAISAYTHPARTFGRSMAGMSRRDGQLLQKSIHRFGGEALRRRIVTTTSTTHFPSRNGFAAQTVTALCLTTSLQRSRLLSRKLQVSRVGYSALSETYYDGLGKMRPCTF